MTGFVEHPFTASMHAYQAALVQFRRFQDAASDNIRLAEKQRALHLKDVYAFHVFEASKLTVQASFGVRPTGRILVDDKPDFERGASLVYSLGPDGSVLVFLYPAKSQSHAAREKWIILEIYPSSRVTRELLLEDTNRHVRALVAYCYATSLDGRTTWAEKILVTWLRLTHRLEVNGEQHVLGTKLLGTLTRLLGTASLIVLLRPFGLLAAVLFLSWLGWRGLAGNLH